MDVFFVDIDVVYVAAAAAVSDDDDKSIICHKSRPKSTITDNKCFFPLRLRVALRGVRYRDADSVSISLATQRNAQR